MTVYLHIIGVHAAEFFTKFGSVGLWSQGPFEAAHKIFRSQMDHTTHDGGRNSRSKIKRDLTSLAQLESDIREMPVDDNCSLRQALIRVRRYQSFDARYTIEKMITVGPNNALQAFAKRHLQVRYNELDSLLPDDITTAKRTIKRFMKERILGQHDIEENVVKIFKERLTSRARKGLQLGT